VSSVVRQLIAFDLWSAKGLTQLS